MSAPAVAELTNTHGLLASIDEPPLASLLARLHDGESPTAYAAQTSARRPAPLPFSAAQGRFLYLIARAIRARSVVELNTTAGVATLYLAAALRDNWGGRLIGSERDPEHYGLTLQHVREAGLADFVDVRLGDPRDTLARDLPNGIDLVRLDGWQEQYGAVFDLLRPHLRPGAVVLADDAFRFPSALAPWLVLEPGAVGVQSVTLPFGSGLEFSVLD